MACSSKIRPNWFVAIPVDLGENYSHMLGSPRGGARVFSREDLHITLAFLGAVEKEHALELWESIDLGEMKPFSIKVSEVALFGPPKKSSAYAITLADEGSRLLAIFQNLADMTRDILAKDITGRTFVPHISFARPKRMATPDQRKESEGWALERDFSGCPVVLIREIALYTWNDDREAKLFRIVERKPFSIDSSHV